MTVLPSPPQSAESVVVVLLWVPVGECHAFARDRNLEPRVEAQSKLPLVGRRWRGRCFSSLPSPPPEPRLVPLLTLQLVLLLHVWFLPLDLPRSSSRVSSFVTGFKCAPLGSSQVSLPTSLTLLSSGPGTVGLSENSGWEQPTVFLPQSRGPSHTRTTHIASWRNLTPVLWCTVVGIGDSQEAKEHRQLQTFLESASSSRVGLGEAGAGQRDPTQLEKLT